MSEEKIIIRLRDIVRDNATEERDWTQMNGETTIKSLGFDSLSILDLLYDVEQEFGIELEATDVVATRTVGDMAELLKQRGA